MFKFDDENDNEDEKNSKNKRNSYLMIIDVFKKVVITIILQLVRD